MLPKVVVAVVILAGLGFFLLKDKLPQTTPQSSQPTKSEESKPLTAEEILALGGTCFTKSFEDQTDYLESQKEASPDISRVTDKNQYDAIRVTLGEKDGNVVSQWDFKENPPFDEHHEFRFWVYHDVGNPKDEDRIEIGWIPKDKKWIGSYVSADRTRKSFDPQTQVSGKSVRFNVPKDLLSKNGKVEKINFTVLVIDKQEKTTYADRIWASDGGPSSKFICP